MKFEFFYENTPGKKGKNSFLGENCEEKISISLKFESFFSSLGS